ncbi:MFS transporter [Kineosporia sp. J2-2]|uniref:MFS transporter n=1 Tax=Kineosporia corallincola TaxID=2835133 RepID=A0ABS5TRL1_9ACTN|nr:MFS transporter [Kineosporia corallincola]MBT0773435.1 MFS transporter [Kineosporia corallincola]
MNAVAPVTAGRREWIALAILCLPALLVTMDLTLLFMAVPNLVADLDPSSTELLWITDIYGFLIAGFLITMGAVGERIGRRRLLMIGAATFGAASVLTAFSQNPEMLIAARALLGVSAATLAPSTLSLLRVMFRDPAQSRTAVTVWTTSFMVGGIVGPIIGGLMLDQWWWGSPFLLAVPVMVLLLVVGPILLPEYRDPNRSPLDLLSVAMSLVALLSVIWGGKKLARDGLEVLPVVVIVVGVVVGALFVMRQSSLAAPLMDVHLFRHRTLSVSVGSLLFTTGMVMGMQYLVATFLQTVLGMSPARAGVWQLPVIIPGMVAAVVATVLASKIGPAKVLTVGLLIGTVGFGMLTQIDGSSGKSLVITASTIMFVGLAPVMALGIGTIVSAAPVERAGAASGLASTANELGGALGIAVIGSIATAAYQNRISDTMPSDVPGGVAEQAEVSLGAAADQAGQLPAAVGGRLLEAAQDAFAHGMAVGAVVAVVVLLVMAVLVAVVLRGMGPLPMDGEAPAAEVAPDATPEDADRQDAGARVTRGAQAPGSDPGLAGA